MMFWARSIQADHKDLVHDVAYDFYGKRFATCSSDHMVKLWDFDNDEQSWFCSSSFKAHSGSVWRVTWAHPEFGQILATCSSDRSVGIWEEKLDGSPAHQPTTTTSSKSATSSRQSSADSKTSGLASTYISSWICRASLVDSRTSVTDVKFAPKHLGLILATCSTDGTLRIYEAPDIMNFTHWNLQHELNCKMSCSCLTWNPSPFSPPMIAVGSDEPPPPPSSISRNPSIISDRSYSLSSIGAGIGTLTGNTVIALGRIQIYEAAENSRRWVRVEVIPIFEPVNDIAFGCNFGRDYHLLAVASSDVKILAITESSGGTGPANVSSQGTDRDTFGNVTLSSSCVSPSPMMSGSFFSQQSQHHYQIQSHKPLLQQLSLMPRYEIRTIPQFDDHNSKVWRVSWNLTGTILSSSGEDAKIRLWKSNYLDSWKSIGIIRMNGSSGSGGIVSSAPPSSSSSLMAGQCLGIGSSAQRLAARN